MVDRLDDHPNISVALGAAHGFKFASWFGRTLADLATGGQKPPSIAPFALSREALRKPMTREAWLV